MQTPLHNFRLWAARFLHSFGLPRVRGLFWFLIGLLWLGSLALVRGQTLYVSTTGTAAPNGAISWAQSTTDLQGAIDEMAATSGTVCVAQGRYQPGGTGNTTQAASFTLPSGVTVMGGYVGATGTMGSGPRTSFPSTTTLTGNTISYHVVLMTNVSEQTRLDGFVITGGNANGSELPDNSGGGIFNMASGFEISSNPSLTDLILTYNQASFGGGMHNQADDNGTANPSLTGVLFSHNTATFDGGGMLNWGFGGTSSPVLTSVTLTANQASSGSGLYNYALFGTTNATLTNVFFNQNSSISEGGAMYNLGISGSSSPVLSSVTLTANSASSGGGSYNEGFLLGEASAALLNVLFSQNTASGTGSTTVGGGAMYNLGNGGTSSPLLTNVTLTANQAENGGGVFNLAQLNGTTSGTANATLTGVLFSQNRATGSGGGLFNKGVDGTSSPVLTNTAFFANQGGQGGAVFNTDAGATISIINASFAYNGAANGGSAIANTNTATATLINSVLFGNSPGGAFSGSPMVGNSLLENVIPANSYTGASWSGGNNLVTSQSPFVDGPGGDLRLKACAAAIDAANPTLYNSSATDLDGKNRTVRTLDIGAYEFQGKPMPSVGVTQQPPASSSVCGESAVTIPFSVSGTGPFSAQLFRNGQLVAAQPGSTTFTLANVQPADAGTYSVVVTGGCNIVTSTAFSLLVSSPTITLLFNNSATVMGTGIPTIIVPNTPGQQFQVLGGTSFGRVIVLDRINGYEVRQNDQNTTGIFSINRVGAFSLTVRADNGCSRTVQGILVNP
jgi:hypothetical protein